MQASRLFVGVISMMITACTIWEPSVCRDGKQCPPGTRCAASQDICILPGCGDGVVEVRAGEECDDGNTMAGDGCSDACHQEVCGNGLPDPDEKCDDGNNTSGDGCSEDCRSTEVCGNFVVDFARGEMCDDGNEVAGDGCSSECKSEYCGNGFTDTAQGEVCDDGDRDSGDGCSGDCRSTETCGNGITDTAAGEVCDDGATISGDGCSKDCRSAEVCGNGVTDTAVGEVCDDSNELSKDGCSADCRSAEVCGNGITDTAVGEVCDDGNPISGDGCREDCFSTESCGNGTRDPANGEVCDDGNNISGDGCSADCLSDEVCGNAAIDTAIGEVCDDGGRDSGDGCSADCRSNETCGNGIVDSDETCDCGAGAAAPGESACAGRQNSNTGGYCNENCQTNCGDGELDEDEECDGTPVIHEFCTDHDFDMGLLGCENDCSVTTVTCQDFGWSEMESPTESTLRDIWGDPSGGTILAVGDDGAVILFNGLSWTEEPSGSLAEVQLKGISGTGPNDIWVVGDDGGPSNPPGRVFHFDGLQWRDEHEGEAPPTILPTLRSVWSLLSGEVFAVGHGSTIRHRTGSMWATDHCNSSQRLSDVWGDSDSNRLFAVSLEGKICRYDGANWERVLDSFNPFHSVWDQHAVGAGGIIYQRNGDGTAWTLVEDLPAYEDLHGIWATPLGDAFAVGNEGTILEKLASIWTDASVFAGDFFGVWGTHPNDVFAVGERGQIWRRGAMWTPSSSAPADNAVLDDVSADGSYIYAVGNRGKLYVNGSPQSDESYNPIAVNLHGIWIGRGVTYAVGDFGTIYESNGSSRWRKQVMERKEHLKSIWGNASAPGEEHDFFVVGAAGTILRQQGGAWTPMESGTMHSLNSVWGSSGNNVFAVGDNGTIRRFDGNGNNWTTIPSPTPDHLRSVWVSDAGDVFVLSGGTGSQASRIWRLVDSTWEPMQLPPGTAGLQKLRGTAPDDLFAVGSDGQVLHYDGVAWAPIATRTFSNFRSLWVEPGRMLVVGDSSYELARKPR